MRRSMFFIITCTLLLSSCSVFGRSAIFDDSNKKADERFEQIIETIKDQDQGALKAMFSKQALSETIDIDSIIIELFQYIQGNIESWESTGAYSGHGEKNADGSGNRQKSIESTYIFTTDEQEYRAAVYEFTVDTANQDNVGVYSICIISSEDDNNSRFTFWGNGEAGINVGKA